jgi:hypothetical protein
MDFASTHIHVAPEDRSWNLSEVKRISRGILMTRDALSKVIRETPCTREWATMNRPDVPSSMMYIANACRKIEEIKTIDDIVTNMSPARTLTWNLRPLLDARGTIEFRRPPQSSNAKAARFWITVALSLIVFFLDQDDNTFAKCNEGVANNGKISPFMLKHFVWKTAGELGLPLR